MATLLAAGALGALTACGGGTGPGGNGGGGSGTVTVELDLSPGASRIVEGGGKQLTMLLPSADGTAEYRLALHTVKEDAGVTAMRVLASPGQASTSSASSATPPGSWSVQELGSDERSLLLRHRVHDSARRLLQRSGIVPARPPEAGSPEVSAATLPTAGTPQVGDTLDVSYLVRDDLSVTCDEDSATMVTGVVQAVGERVAMVEDTAVPDLGSQFMEYDALAQEFDSLVFGVNVAYFGGPTDIDSNNRVLVFFTTEVNKLNAPGSETRIGGFFVAADLAESGDPAGDGTSASGICGASNESELLYLLAPDPRGVFGQAVSSGEAKRNARSVSAHEFEHLLNAANRLFKGEGTFADLPATWLDEGLAHLAEEVVGFKKTGESLRANLGFSSVTEDQAERDDFRTFHLNNFLRLRRYFLDPAGTRALVASDPGGAESLKMRGFAWLFVRWLGDQVGPDGSGILEGSREEELFRGLAQADGGLDQGVENVERETGRSWSDLVSDFVVMPAVDDSAPASLSGEHELLSWNLPAVFRGLNQDDDFGSAFPESYPLDVTVSGFISRSFDVAVQAGTARHLWFTAEGSTSDLTLELTDTGGGALPSGVRVTVVRTR